MGTLDGTLGCFPSQRTYRSMIVRGDGDSRNREVRTQVLAPPALLDRVTPSLTYENGWVGYMLRSMSTLRGTMKRTWLWKCMVPSLVLTMLLTSCGQNVTDRPGTPEPTPNSTSSVSSANSPVRTSSIAGSTSTTQPQETCVAFLPSAPCTGYTSISGTDDGKDLPWVTSNGLKAALSSINGQLLLSIRTGCGPLSGPAQITGNTFTVRDIAIGASGCTDVTGEQQSWVMDFLKRPIEMTFNQGTLLWKSGTDSLSFKSD